MIGFELPFVSWIFHDERPRVTRARERPSPLSPLLSFPFPSLVTARACVNRCTRVGYIDFKRHAARLYISRRRISYSHKRNGDPLLAGNFYRWKCIVPVFFSCEKYEYIRKKMLIVYESFTRIIGSKKFFKNIYIYLLNWKCYYERL